MSELLEALMESGEYNLFEAKELFRQMQSRVQDGEDPEEVLYDEGLEPDYVLDLI